MILNGIVYSKRLEMDTSISIVSPSNYRASGEYKLAYLLHGLKGNSDSWINNTMLTVYADEYDIVFVMPEVARSFYFDMEHGLDYYKYISDELPIIIKNLFNVSAKREDTLVIGASMGGYGALKLALNNLDTIGTCCSFSPAILFFKEFLDANKGNLDSPELIKQFGKNLIKDFKSIFVDDFNLKDKDNILELVKKIDNNLNLYLSSADNDFLLQECLRFNAYLDEKNIDYKYEELKGEHDWYFFNKALKNSLEWYAKIKKP